MKFKSVMRGVSDDNRRYSIATVARAIHKTETQIRSFMSQTYGGTKGGLSYEQVKEAIEYKYKTKPSISWEGIEELQVRLKSDGYVFSEMDTDDISNLIDEEE